MTGALSFTEHCTLRIARVAPSGVDRSAPIAITPDERSYAYGLRRIVGDLYLVHGLK
mgnify:CR=1 FL=1